MFWKEMYLSLERKLHQPALYRKIVSVFTYALQRDTSFTNSVHSSNSHLNMLTIISVLFSTLSLHLTSTLLHQVSN